MILEWEGKVWINRLMTGTSGRLL